MKLLSHCSDGSAVDAVLLVREVERRHKRDGTPFLRLTLADRSGTVPAVLWDLAETPTLERGHAVQIAGRLNEHPRYGRQVTIDAISTPSTDNVPWEELVDGPSRLVSDLCEDLTHLVASVRDAHLSALLSALLGPETPTGRAYRQMPAAKVHHHAYAGGLLEHCVGIAQLVCAAAIVFPGIDRDVAVCGALLHDIGKLEAYVSGEGCADLSDAGKLEGEIPLGYFRVRREVEAIGGFPPERARALLHVILAHHGRLEYGSPVAPGTREAALVHAIDNLSGQLGAFDRLEKALEPGERWSRYDRVLGGCAFFNGAASA